MAEADDKTIRKAYKRYRKTIGRDAESMSYMHFAEHNYGRYPATADNTSKTERELRKSGATWKEIRKLQGR